MNRSFRNEGIRAFLETMEDPTTWDFFSFVRWVEGAQAPGSKRVGHALALEDDPLLFHQAPHLIFAPSTLKEVVLTDPQKRGPAARVRGYFLGLLGPSGPLPISMTDYVWARSMGVHHPDRTASRVGGLRASTHRSRTLEDFLNVFNHRFLALFYRAWASCRIAVDFDRPDEAKFPNYVGSFIGMGMPSFRRRLEPVQDESIFYFAAHLANRTRYAEGLAAIISDYFGTAARVLENHGHWLELPMEDQCKLGGAARVILGDGVPIGSRIWDRQLRFVLRVGPMSLRSFESLYPGTVGLVTLRRVVKLYTNNELFCTVQLVLDRREAPEPRLGSGVRLGYSTWLLDSGKEGGEDLDQLMIDLD